MPRKRVSGQNGRPHEASRSYRRAERGRPERLGDVLPQLMAKVGFQRTRGQEELEEAWLEAVGREMGIMTRPTGVSGGKLQVQVDHNVIAQELRFREKDLLETLRRALPEEQLTGIRYRVLGR